MNKPKILFIGPLPPPYSGPELSMKQFMDSQVLRESFEIMFLQTNFRTSNKSKGKMGLGMILNFFVFFGKLSYTLLSQRPELVYYPVTPTQFGWLGRDVWTIIFSKMSGAKILIHLRGSHFKINFSSFSPVAKKIIGLALKEVDMAIVQANYLKDQFHPFIPSAKTVRLYQAMDCNEFAFTDFTARVKGKILVIGHMTKAKGYNDILKILPEVAAEFPEVQFCFAGEMRKGERGVFFNQFTKERIEYEDPFEAEQKIISSMYAKNYLNLGLISGEQKLKHLQSAHLFVSASYSEGFSRALLESMSVGTPLVYSLVGAHREVLNELNGESFIPGDLPNLKASILKMLKNLDIETIGRHNRNQTEKYFSVNKICNDLRIIINQTLNQH